MWFREVTMQVMSSLEYKKQITIKSITGPITEVAQTLEVAKLAVRYVVKMNECICELSNNRRPGTPWKTTEVHYHRILFLVNALEQVDLSFSIMIYSL